ncbi:MAG: T9SS type A sorting domain-containing protein, partial [Bacteroidia bacterium]|nr:T9SS type A sorting domain-containing protein [Bacteroidia bacterium]
KGIQIDWTSLTEIGVDHYEIERSNDEQQFFPAGTKMATENNAIEKSYSWFDTHPLTGKSFYRIKAVEKNGTYKYSKIISVTEVLHINKDLLLYPNPVIGNRLAIKVGDINAGQYRLVIADMNGRQVYNQTFDHLGGTFSESIQLPSAINLGIYSFKLSGKNINMTKNFVVQ